MNGEMMRIIIASDVGNDVNITLQVYQFGTLRQASEEWRNLLKIAEVIR